MGSNSGWRNWGDHPVIVLFGFLATLITIVAFLTGKTSLTGFIPTATPSIKPTIIIPTPTLNIGDSTRTSPKDNMIMMYVSAGSFEMGKNYDFTVEGPAHTVQLDAYWIDKTVVTNAMYERCEKAVICNPPNSFSSATHPNYYNNPDFDNFPVINISWEDAKTYCIWADRRLPTEAEWEKAARGTGDRIYTWGNENPNSSLLNFNNNIGDTTAVDSYPAGASPYGALDMTGNVFQWVADWYSETYYSNSPLQNPLGPESGQYRVLKGGGWGYTGDFLRPSHRSYGDPSTSFDIDIGFRCARSE